MKDKPEPLKGKGILNTDPQLFIGLNITANAFSIKEIKSAVEWLDGIYFRLDNHFKSYYTNTEIKDLFKEYCKIYNCDFDNPDLIDINNFKKWLLKKAFEDVIEE